ncbi:hypothetical protein KB221_07525 [Aquidulcibacter paucihalophilus]|nr:hypothetical protein KB221_07525 [Aquidulcibacter paucihalophilus]
MRRAELLQIVGIPATTYNALNNRGHLPFAGRATATGWTDFQEEQAVRLALLMDLARAGLPQSHAATLVRNHFDDLLDLANEGRPSDAGRFLFGGATLETTEPVRAAEPVIRPIIAVTGTLDKAIRRVAVDHGSGSDVQMLAIVLVDVTTTISALYRRVRTSDVPNAEMQQWAILFGAEKGRLISPRGERW